MIFVADRIEEIAQSYPHQTAIVNEEDERITYQQLDRQATSIAELLIDLLNLDSTKTFQETQTVGILMERTAAIAMMFLAIHKAGCAYVPVDPAFPPDRQSYILEHSKCNVLIVDQECFEGARKQQMEIPSKFIFVSDDKGNIIARYEGGKEVPLNQGRRKITAKVMKELRELNRNPEALAYVLYTSGSTGKPKGVAVKQIGVDNIIKFFSDELKVGITDRVMGLTTFCFDISVLETFVPLTRGATFVLAKSATRKDPFRILDLMEQFQVTIFQATPTTYEMMMATGWNGNPQIKLLIGGEAFRPTLIPLAKNCADLLNVYGPTETTIWSTFFRVLPNFNDYAKELNIKGVPIGRAISETTLYLVGESQPWKEVPFGEEGELFIGGIGVAAGYLHAPHLTKERFIPNPFGHGFVYRTGDSVKQLPDGNYIFMRRLDDQVKIDGFRIELEEIEKVFMQHEAVEQAVALVRENKLVIYIKPAPHVPLSCISRSPKANSNDDVKEYALDPRLLEGIYSHASKHLTYYMIPKFTVIVTEFPKTPNGKLDKKALVTPAALLESASKGVEKGEAGTIVSSSFASVSLKDEERPVSAFICDAIEQLRGVRPHLSSSLSSFGLDSLGSVMLLRQISNALKGEIPLRMQELFSITATIRSLGELLYLRASKDTRAKLKLIPEKPEDASDSMEGGEATSGRVNRPDYFGAVLLSNRRLMDGLRGLFTGMVLFNHWHSSGTYVTTALNVDTTLFYMISGFTTASQLRSIVEIKKTESGDLSILPKPRLDLGNFFLIRAVGLYPIMWLSLVINAPVWLLQDQYQFPHHAPNLPQSSESATCTFLYVIGMNVWSQTCTTHGPDVRYASGLIITMIIYGFLRYLWTSALRHYSSSIDLTSLTTKSKAFTESITLADPKQSWKEYFGKLSVYLGYNLYHKEVFWYYFLFYSIVGMAMLWQNVFLNVKLVSSVEYFGVCACLLVLCEMLCGRRILLQQKKEQDEQLTNVSSPLLRQHFNVVQEDLSSPWDPLRPYFAPITNSMTKLFNQLSDHDYSPIERTSNEELAAEEVESRYHSIIKENTEKITCFQSMIHYLWRFTPDLIVLGCFLSLTCLGELCSNKTLSTTIENAVIPTGFLLFLIISLHQRGKERYNISRFLLESEIMTQIGYASYPIYLIQNPLLQLYFTYLIHHKDYTYHSNDPDREYFRNLPFGYRLGSVLLVIVIGWLIQKFYQDWFIANLFAKVLSWWKQQERLI